MMAMKFYKSPGIFLLLSIISGIAGIYFIFNWFHKTSTLSPVLSLIALIPALAFYISYETNKRITNKQLKAAIDIPCLLGLIISVFIIWGANSFVNVTTRVTDPDDYLSVMSEYWKNSSLTTHFPPKIPNDATNVKFSFLPGFLQGGSHIQLSYKLQPGKIEELYSTFLKKKVKSFRGGNKSIHINQKDGAPTTYYRTSEDAAQTFPYDFEIMTFDRKKYKSYNHASCHGVAISKKRNIIVYWAEDW